MLIFFLTIIAGIIAISMVIPIIMSIGYVVIMLAGGVILITYGLITEAISLLLGFIGIQWKAEPLILDFFSNIDEE